MATYVDLKILNQEFELDAASNPQTYSDRDVVAQDVKHMIIDSHLLLFMIGERSREKRALIIKKIQLLVEEDERIEPGSCEIHEISSTEFFIYASTEFGEIRLGGSNAR